MMPNRFTKPKIPTTPRMDLIEWIIAELEKMPRIEATWFLISYFTTVDLDLIKQDMIARKDLTTLE
jgi:hypothetical protein